MIKPQATAGKRLASVLLAFLILFFVFNLSVQSVFAQMAVVSTEVASVPTTVQTVKQSIWQTIGQALLKAGSIAFNRTLSTVLNKIAYDAANYIGSGGEGQSPLFYKQNLVQILVSVSDEAAGQFLETFVNNLGSNVNNTCSDQLGTCRNDCSYYQTDAGRNDAVGYTNCVTECDKEATACVAKTANSNTNGKVTPSFNICSPSSIEAKLKIGLGLVDQNRPQGPNCTVSKLIKTWGTDINKKLQDLRDPNYLDEFRQIFDPRANDLMTYSLAVGDMQLAQGTNKDIVQSEFITNKGWLDVRDIGGAIQGVPGEAQAEADAARKARQEALGKTTGDILVDAANLFLNQLYISSLNNLLQHLGEKSSNPSGSSSGYASDPRSNTGQTALREVTTTLLQPKFGSLADYNVVSSLAICLDSKNPGPDNCVIDDKFMQGITEQKTVAEAVKNGYLHGDWQINADNRGDSYHSSYSLRNISILRKYRILPVGWEEAAKIVSDSANPKKATLNDLISCFDPTDQYNQFSSDFGADRGWCEGLVDPNWVLKSPLNYCGKEGAGPQILSKTVTPAAGAGPSELNVVRADGYCADNKTCIQEKKDGSCEAYGYCNEERRTWNFGTDSCQAVNNTCEAFTGAGGGTVAYLKNTLDYANCNAENSGCRQYALGGVYNTALGTVAWDGAQSLYLNKNLSSCDGKNEGCTGLLRVKPSWGGNLVMDSGLESGTTDNWPLIGNVTASIVDAGTEPGGASGKALKLTGNSVTSHGVYSDNGNSLLPDNFQVTPGQSYTISVDVYIPSASAVTDTTLSIGNPADGFTKTTSVKDSWQHLSATRPAGTSYNEPTFRLASANFNNPATFYLKNLKFEMSDWDTGYTPYGSFKFYEKLLPNYLEAACYADTVSAIKDYNLKPNAPAACSSFARRCNKEDVGCELYTAVKNNFPVAAKVTSGDYCPGECVGYDVYIAKGNYFNLSEPVNLIPDKAKSCSAAAAGCNEFTNLDTLAQGGEQREYYTILKQCVKPDALACASFYSWEGTGSGPQLKAYTLKKDAGNNPAVTADDSALCSAVIYNKPVSDPAFNPDCREFYNSAGQVSYHLSSRTITCSDNCHAYRLTEKNVGNVCQNGGIWDATHDACIYQAIPGEGQTCQAAANGCREYNGNDGANVRLAAAYDFENGLGNWFSNCRYGVTVSAVSNSKDGHSLLYDSGASSCGNIGTKQIVLLDAAGTDAKPLRLIEQLLAANSPVAQVKVKGLVSEGGAYSLKFLARTAGANNVNLQIYLFNDDTGAKAYFNTTGAVTVKSGGDWGVYQANLATLDHSIGSEEILVISADGNVFLDNVILSEITDRYYLIKDSSQIPDVCSYDIFDNYQGLNYNLGCSQYSDRDGTKHNLHRFTQLCSDSAVGCEQVIDTKNSAAAGAAAWKDGVTVASCAPGDLSCAAVSGDSAIYAIYDSSQLCTAPNQGCSRLGEAQGGTNLTGWSDVFKKNNPDQYSSILCGAGAAGCEEWKTASGASTYFKNPGFAACSYRASQNPTVPGKAWYKVAVKRCDTNGNGTISGNETSGQVCTGNTDCGSSKCLADTNDYPCSVSYFKTIGLGGAGNQIPTPDRDAGLCDKASSGCTEYIDPVSQFSVNLIKNPGYAFTDAVREGWGAATGDKWQGISLSDDQQVIRLRPNTLYNLHTRLNGTGGQVGHVGLDFVNGVKPLLNDNTLGTTTNRIGFAGDKNEAFIFNSLSNTATRLTGGADGKIVELEELAIDYQLSNNIDKTSCNGLSKFDNGCILFNERGVSGSSGLSALNYDAYNSADGAVATACDPAVIGDCTANTLVKVRPDRVCSKWLDCVTYIQDPVTKQKTCYAMGECDRLDDKGECANFTETAVGLRRFNPETDKNATGYSMLDTYNFGQMREVGINTDVRYDFEPGGGGTSASCKNSLVGAACAADGFVLINGPVEAVNATDYPADGKSYLQVKSTVFVSPGDITLNPGTYYINYLVNTNPKSSAFGLKARVILTDDNDKVLSDSATGEQLIFDAAATSGWQRQVNKFTLDGGAKKVRIYLSSDQPSAPSASSVYFDDINIEPVLETGNGEYATRACRLYPATDSLTCTSKSNNVVANGLEGYCLAYDPANPGVCLMWYPADRIATAKNVSAALGYHGTYPLYYCAEASGNFELVEYRSGYVKSVHNDKCIHRNYLNQCRDDVNWFSESCPTGYFGIWAIRDNDVPDSCATDYQDSNMEYYCIPRSSSFVSGLPTVHSTGIQNNRDQCAGYGFDNGWAIYDGSFVGNENTIEVYNKDNGQKIGITDFRLTCNKFVQTVDPAGDNKAWVERVGTDSVYSGTTSNFFVDDSNVLYAGSPYQLSAYGRDNADVIFGAASFADGFNLLDQHERIPLRNRYSAGNEQPLAGRPYGCDNGSGSGCGLIGYCANDNKVFCLVGYNNTCNSGTCHPLWNQASPLSSVSPENYKKILSKLFLKSYNGYNFSGTAYQASSTLVSYNDYTSGTGTPPFSTSNCVRSGEGLGSFCPVYPILTRINLYYGDSSIPFKSDPVSSQSFEIKQKGIYRLEFNSQVDPEQQPLKNIEINWGDGHIQTITGQGQHPTDPHVFYHYYTQTGPTMLGVTIRDNWDFYRSN